MKSCLLLVKTATVRVLSIDSGRTFQAVTSVFDLMTTGGISEEFILYFIYVYR